MKKGEVVQKIDIIQTNEGFKLTPTVTLIFKTAIQNCHTTLRLMMIHNYTKFGCKSQRFIIIYSEDMEETKKSFKNLYMLKQCAFIITL